MRKKLYKNISRLLVFFVTAVICITAYFGVRPLSSVKVAAENNSIAFNNTDVLDDLSEMTIDG